MVFFPDVFGVVSCYLISCFLVVQCFSVRVFDVILLIPWWLRDLLAGS